MGLVFLLAAISVGISSPARSDAATMKQELSARLEKIEHDLAELRDHAKAKGKEAKDKTIKALEEERAKVKTKLASLKEDSKSGWKTVKKKVSNTVDKVHDKAKSALDD